MRTLMLIGWLALPLIGLAYHHGPGQEGLALDEAAAALAEGEELAADGDHQGAIAAYDRALELLPGDAGDADKDAAMTDARRRVALARCRSQMFVGQLPQANQALGAMLSELTAEADADPELVAATRDALANSQYYMTWLLRLEGAPREEWAPHIESARQNYRLLAERSGDRAGARAASAAKAKENLDASIRLARMDLGDLQGLPLPSQ